LVDISMPRLLLAVVALAVRVAAIQYRAPSTVSAAQNDCPGWCNNFARWQSDCQVAWWATVCTPCVLTWPNCVSPPPPSPPNVPPAPPFSPVPDLLAHSAVPGLVPSTMFSCRIRLMSEAWQSSFVYMSTSIPQFNGGPPAYLPGHSNGYFPSLEGWTSSWISFEVAIGAVVELEITKEFDDHVIWSATVQPAERAVASIVGNRAIIRLTGAQQFTVDIDGALQEHNTGYPGVGPYASHRRVVHTFTVYANPRLGVLERPSPYDPDVRTVTPGETPPTIFSESMLYFLPGVHNITNMPSCCVTTDFSASCPCVKHNNSWPGYVARYELQSGKSYYIPSDAWLNGGITTAPSISGTRVFGYGHISGHLYRWKLGYGNIGGLITNWINDTHIVGPMFVDFPNHNILGQGSVSRIDPLCAHPACIVTKNTLRHIKTLGWRLLVSLLKRRRHHLPSTCPRPSVPLS